MREIKFRGRTAKGHLVYGDLLVTRDHLGEIIYAEILKPATPNHAARVYRVKTDSVQQFIEVDKNGRTVYEGDVVIRVEPFDDETDDRNYPMAATFEDYGAIRDGEIIWKDVPRED